MPIFLGNNSRGATEPIWRGGKSQSLQASSHTSAEWGIGECIDNFEMIVMMISREVEVLYLGYFMNGLREEIKNWVRILGPETRFCALQIARNVKIAMGRKTGMGGVSRDKVEGELGEGGHMTPHPSFKVTGFPKGS